jgi:amidohydrolase
MASSDTFSIDVHGRRAHGAKPHEGLDPIPVAAEIVQALQLVASRQIDAQRPKVLTIGRIQGGSRFNILADRVTLEGTIRSLDPDVRRELKERMARTVKGVAEAHGTRAELRFLGDGNAPTVNDAALARASAPVLRRVFGETGAREIQPQMVAEDFWVYAERVPGFFFLLGTRNPPAGIESLNHTDTFDVDEAVLPLGVRALATLAWDFLARGGR